MKEAKMAETVAALRQEALSWLKDTSTAFMATVEENQPRTRPVSILWREESVWLTSGTSNGKTQQARRHPNVELCVPIERDGQQGYVRLAGTAEIVTDPQIRARIAVELPFFDTFWDGPDDPRYTLIRVLPSEILYLRPEEDHHQTIYL
jgi:general stress protein 26